MLFALAVYAVWNLTPHDDDPSPLTEIETVSPPVIQTGTQSLDDVKPLPDFVKNGMQWLADAQFENGGWGAGSHARQDIRDPGAVQIDPATTAFSAMALMRSGSTLTDGPYQEHVTKAVHYMLELVENYPEEGVSITNIRGTQPQAKLGQNIDVSMTAQLFTRVLPHTKHDPALENRVRRALEICLDKLSRAQSADGSWNDRGGWASVLQSAMANNAFEMAADADLEIDQDVLERSRAYQKSNVDEESGEVRTESAAGISLYSLSSNQRATAKEAKQAQDLIEQGRRDGVLGESAAPTGDNLEKMGVSPEQARELESAFRQNKLTREKLQQDDVLRGFGNNGGEEFLSFMMTSESLVVTGGEDWNNWYSRMFNLLSSIQNNDGSWSGHHCITSPVFCTAAVILAMSADRDLHLLKNQQQGNPANG